MALKKKEIMPLSAVRGDFITSLQNVMDAGNLLLAVLETALQHGAINGKVQEMVIERTKAFREAMYGGED